jgi:hypothetical protein
MYIAGALLSCPTTEVTSRLDHFIVTAVDLAASSSGLRGRKRTCLTILQREWSANFKMVRMSSCDL